LLECQALATLYNTTGGNSWFDRANWFVNPNYCTWHGVLCTAGDAGNVMEISLDANNLSGAINTVPFQNLQQMRVFDLNENQVGGQIPASLAVLPLLTNFDVGQNLFTNDVPAQLWGRPDLVVLDLSENGFTGPLAEIASTVIQSIDISGNAFDSDLPASLWTRTALGSLDIANNLFTGSIPTTISAMAALSALDVSDNLMSGPVPDEIVGVLGGTDTLALHGNCGFTASAGTTTFLNGKDPFWAELGENCP
jgi:hypothetical protein